MNFFCFWLNEKGEKELLTPPLDGYFFVISSLICLIVPYYQELPEILFSNWPNNGASSKSPKVLLLFRKLKKLLQKIEFWNYLELVKNIDVGPDYYFCFRNCLNCLADKKDLLRRGRYRNPSRLPRPSSPSRTTDQEICRNYYGHSVWRNTT